MNSISNNIKACMFLGDMSNSCLDLSRAKAITVQTFDYQVYRLRNDQGVPYGPTQRSILQLTVKSLPDGYTKDLYGRLKEMDTSAFSVVLNAEFMGVDAEEPALENFENAFVARGYVIAIDEDFDSCAFSNQEHDEADLMMLHISILLESITYLGDNSFYRRLNIN